VRYVLEAIERKYAYTAKRRPGLDDPARVERQESFQEVIDQFLAGSIPAHLVGQGRFAVDASAIDSAARGKKMPQGTKKERARAKAERAARTDAENAELDALAAEVNADSEAGHSYDPDARWGYRTKTFDNKTKKCFGYQLIAFTRVGAVGQEGREPLLIDRHRGRCGQRLHVCAFHQCTGPFRGQRPTGNRGRRGPRLLQLHAGQLGLRSACTWHRAGSGPVRGRLRHPGFQRRDNGRRVAALPGHAGRAGGDSPPGVLDGWGR